MKVKLLEIIVSIVLGFFSGILLSGNGNEIPESGIHIMLGCIFWMLVFIYLRLK
ncbi:hypothetical protein KZ483_27805 [Paenibacillus sp. sptzw28]|uniref:hypothetical protein n=1 Tax=Paenibacillus sp. sptzw28 TaxID=715179 RepID=UPI001C6E3FEA|nr:hypothetical protein [Paenibacillus sp. sptzw28]QYR21427.1 hypothetical protein KZ483_27805 [Paenibacillus sp. sptzw28]